MQVVALLHAGCDSDKQLASELGLTDQTVKMMFSRLRDRLYRQFGVRPTRSQLVLWWERLPYEPGWQEYVLGTS